MKRRFSTVQLALGIVLAAILFTALSLAWPAIVHGGPPSPLKPEHMRLIAEKEQARRNAGIPIEAGSDNAYVKANVPVRQFSKTIKVTKEELERALETSSRTIKNMPRNCAKEMVLPPLTSSNKSTLCKNKSLRDCPTKRSN